MRLTSREREIVEIVRKEPLISQDELAARLNITRSSVAVHISNLMKKGIILGKGYVFNERVSCVVLGECHVAINVTPSTGMQAAIGMSMGGFGFTMSRSLTKFGLDVKLLSIFGTDEDGDRLLSAIQKSAVDVAHAYRPNGTSSTKIVNIRSKDNPVSFEQSFNTWDYQKLLDAKEWLAVNCQWLVVQPRLMELVLSRMRGHEELDRKFICTCLSTAELDQMPSDLSLVQLIVLGCQSDEMNSSRVQDQGFIERGAGNVVVTDGRNIISVSTPEGSHEIPVPPGQGFDLPHGLNDFACGVIYGLTGGYPVRQAIRIGMGVVNRVEARE
ncbi:MAG: PfkB family carbohydrate kinase [Candidatus Saccharibacteria bacterium]